MNLVYFIDHLRPDGTQTALCQLIKGLASRGHHQTIFCLNDSWDEILVDRLRVVGADVRVVGKAALASGYGLVSIWRWLRNTQLDAAITLLFVSDVIGRVVAKAAGVSRIVSSIRTRNVDYSLLQRWLVRATMSSADAVIVNSTHLRDFAIRQEGARPERIYFIPNGVSIADYDSVKDRYSLRAALELPNDRKLVGSVGRLTLQKGFDVLLKAIFRLNRDDIHVVIIGVGKEEHKLRALTVDLGIQKHVHFLGYRRDVPQLLGCLDLYVHSARFEGMPNAVVEAMAAACPIVATRVDGNCDLIEDGTHGWLIPPEDADALAAAVNEALSDPSEARLRGAAAQQRVATHFTVEAMVSAWEKILAGEQA